jgi:hypothetical protein
VSTPVTLFTQPPQDMPSTLIVVVSISVLVGFQFFSSSELLTTDTELIAIAAPAMTGFSMPSAASGMPSTL